MALDFTGGAVSDFPGGTALDLTEGKASDLADGVVPDFREGAPCPLADLPFDLDRKPSSPSNR
ncbi:hypothetical protein [Paenarthrobacter nitroguajacolicus]|uniref:hypothetical protein n=1 Tax=Paenarthrobacter nitroguajacolicus TaxID=211146 RepID=UPI00248AA725|nr:hypothetical protein [Paenarthrobacter nitroguajacolicus]